MSDNTNHKEEQNATEVALQQEKAFQAKNDAISLELRLPVPNREWTEKFKEMNDKITPPNRDGRGK